MTATASPEEVDRPISASTGDAKETEGIVAASSPPSTSEEGEPGRDSDGRVKEKAEDEKETEKGKLYVVLYLLGRQISNNFYAYPLFVLTIIFLISFLISFLMEYTVFFCFCFFQYFSFF